MDAACDQKTQQKQLKCSATVLQDKILLQINDNVTYKGELEVSPYFDTNQLKSVFQKGEMQILYKTTSKMGIKIGFIKLQLLSDENRQLLDMKKKIQQLEDKLKSQKQWEQDDLDSKSPFDLNYIYKIDTSSGWSILSTCVSTTTINFNYSGTNYTTSSSNRRANTTGWTVTKMMKFKVT